MFSLKGKTAIVTGSDRGIGRGIAVAFAKAGANVVIASVHKEGCDITSEQIKKYGVGSFSFKCDVSKEYDVKRLVEATVKKFKRLDIIVNNAGVLLQKPIDTVTEKEWDFLINIDLRGVFYGTKYAVQQMKKQKSGSSIINVSSIAGLVGMGNLTTYCAAKGGIIALTRSSAIELAPFNIRVNAICPGLIDTPMTEGMTKNKKVLSNFLNQIPLKSVGKPEDIGYGALYLASDEARYVTGQALVIDGGWTVQ